MLFKNITDITGSDETYIYESENSDRLQKPSGEKLKIKNYIVGDSVYYLKVPILEKEIAERFNNILELLNDDYDDAFEKIEDEVEWIYIFSKNSQEIDSEEKIINNSDKEKIIGNYGLNELGNQFEHNKQTVIKVLPVEQCILFNENYECGIPFKVKRLIGRRFYKLTQLEQRFYVKNVMLSEMRVSIPVILENLKIETGIINILHKNVVPNLARNNINDEIRKEIGYAIGKAMHLWVAENIEMNGEEKILIQEFIEKYYKENNQFLNCN
jgi:molecular chaperone HtpG